MRPGLPVGGHRASPGYKTFRPFRRAKLPVASEKWHECSLISSFSLCSRAFTELKTPFQCFQVSLNMMCQSDSTSADVEIRKPSREHHLSGATDCLIVKPAVWSFFLRSIVHSSLIILILLFGRILGLPFVLQAEFSRSTSSIPTSVRAIKVADGSQFVWFLSGQRRYIFHRCLLLFFVFVSWLSEPRLFCRTLAISSLSAGNSLSLLRQ